MPEGNVASFALSLGVGGLKISASGPSGLVLATGTTVGLTGIGVFCFRKAAAGVQLLSSIKALELGVGIGIGIGIGIFYLIKALKNKIQENC